MFLAIERREQCRLGGSLVGFGIDDIHPDVRFAKGALLEAGEGGMVDRENEDGYNFGKQLRWCLR